MGKTLVLTRGELVIYLEKPSESTGHVTTDTCFIDACLEFVTILIIDSTQSQTSTSAGCSAPKDDLCPSWLLCQHPHLPHVASFDAIQQPQLIKHIYPYLTMNNNDLPPELWASVFQLCPHTSRDLSGESKSQWYTRLVRMGRRFTRSFLEGRTPVSSD